LFNETYDTTFYQVQGDHWEEVNNKTKKIVLQATVTTRTPEYIELFMPSRNETYRFSATKMELKKAANNYMWAATGRWVRNRFPCSKLAQILGLKGRRG